jgi:hypothetical protein
MNNFLKKVSQQLGPEKIAAYPELYHKKNYNIDLSYKIAIANSAILYDESSTSSSINWKLI